jgi:hypothetical protein
MLENILTPGAPGDPVRNLRAKDLKNVPLLVKPGALREQNGQDDKPWIYRECEVVVLDRAGIVERSDNVRISWVRAMPQLEAAEGKSLACRPTDTGEGIVLNALEGDALRVAQRVVSELDGDA